MEHVDELVSVNIAKDWNRTARVNLLKISVTEALAWLRSPPAVHQKWARLVCAFLAACADCAAVCTDQVMRSESAKSTDYELQGQQAQVDQMLPDVLLFPAGSDLHDHPLVTNGSLVLQARPPTLQ